MTSESGKGMMGSSLDEATAKSGYIFAGPASAALGVMREIESLQQDLQEGQALFVRSNVVELAIHHVTYRAPDVLVIYGFDDKQNGAVLIQAVSRLDVALTLRATHASWEEAEAPAAPARRTIGFTIVTEEKS